MKKRITSLILIMVMIFGLAGCGNDTESKNITNDKIDTDNELQTPLGEAGNDVPNKAMGRYVEEEVVLPETFGETEEPQSIYLDKDNNLKFSTMSGPAPENIAGAYAMKDGKWVKETTEWSKRLYDDGYMVNDVFLGQDGREYAIAEYYREIWKLQKESAGKETDEISEKLSELYSNSSKQIFRIGEDGSSYEEVTPDNWDDDVKIGEDYVTKKIVDKVGVAKNGMLVYVDGFEDKLEFYDTVNKKQKVIADDIPADYVLKENKLYGIDSENKVIKVYDLEGMSLEDIINVEADMDNCRLLVKDNKEIYLLNSKGIHRYALSGTLWETIVDGTLYTMSSPSFEADGMWMSESKVEGGKDEFFVYYYPAAGGHGTKLAKYFYNPDIAAVPDKELTVYSLWDNNTMRQAISSYQQKHSDVRINYITAMSEESTATIADQIRALNTEVLAGKGADVFLLDGLPIDSYIEKGVLADMSGFLLPMVESGELLSNIAKNYVEDGKVYGMPLRFSMPVYLTDKETAKKLGGLNDIASLAGQLGEEQVFGARTYENLVTCFLYTYYQDLLKEDGSIDKAQYESFLNNLQIIAKNTKCNSDNEDEINFQSLSGISATSRFTDTFSNNSMMLLGMNIKAVLLNAHSLLEMMMDFGVKKEIDGELMTVNSTYIPNGIIGMNNATENRELAEDFIKSALSREIQDTDLNDGFSMNTASLENYFADVKSEEERSAAMFMTLEDGSTIELECGWPTKEERTELMELIKSLKNPVNNDAVMVDMIVSQSLDFFEGKKNAGQTADEVANKIFMYMSE